MKWAGRTLILSKQEPRKYKHLPAHNKLCNLRFPEEIHYPIGGNRYKHVVTGEEIEVDSATGWKGILEQRINDAFQGKALSKIVRG